MRGTTISQALQKSATEGETYVRMLSETCGDVGLYRPAENDPQEPHLRDEVYIISSGSGMFFCGDQRVSFAPGDVFFVPRGVQHRFEDFSEDFATWVIFFGPVPTK